MNKNTVTIDLEIEQIDAIVLQELKTCYEGLVREWNLKIRAYNSREEHWKTIEGFERVISYFSIHSEFEEYIQKIVKD
jgi:hypothetical protein